MENQSNTQSNNRRLLLALIMAALLACNILPTSAPAPNLATLVAAIPSITPAAALTPIPTSLPPPTLVRVPTSLPRPTFTRASTSASVPTRGFTPTPVGVPPSPVEQLLMRCPTAQEVAAINADLKLSLEYDPTRGKLDCTAASGSADLTPLQRRVYQRLLVMKRLTFSKPLPWTNKTLYAWFADEVDGIRFRSDIQNPFCCDPHNTINIIMTDLAFSVWDHGWLDPQGQGHGAMNNIALLVHEARHAEGGLAHNCQGRDKKIADLRSYGVEYYLYVWLADYSDPTFLTDPTYRAAARTEAERIRKNSFCEEPQS